MNKKFELLREAVGCYKANHVSGDTNEKALLQFINELEQLTIPVVSNTEGNLCDKCYDTGNFYLGTTCPKCSRPFRSVKA